jgi:hypothetical protein
MSLKRVGRSGISFTSSPKGSRSLTDASGLPGPVQSLTGSATLNTAISLSWSAPLNAGDSAVSSYTVTGSPVAGTIVVTGATASITGLTAATAYTFTVKALNSIGSGPSVISATITTPNFNAATGGTVTTVSNYNGTGQTWKVHEFATNANLVVTSAAEPFSVYIGGGNGGGGSSGCCGSCASRASFGAQFLTTTQTLTATTYAAVRGGGGGGGSWSVSSNGGGPGGASSFAGISRAGGAGGPSASGAATTTNIRGAGNVLIGNQSWSGACGDGYNGTAGINGLVIVAYRVG